MTAITGVEWVDELDQGDLIKELARHGVRVPDAGEGDHPQATDEEAHPYQLLPIETAWLRLERDERGRLLGSFVPDPRHPEVTDGSLPIRLDDDATDLAGWMIARADIDGSGLCWVNVLRRPEREAYVALVYRAGESAPIRSLLVRGIYPDICLVDGGLRVAFVEPDPERAGGQRAVVASSSAEQFDATRTVIAESGTGGLAVRPCSVRRFFKLSRGIRSARVWDLVDTWRAPLGPTLVPGLPHEPELFDVALLHGEPVLIQLFNGDGSWTLQASTLDQGEVQRSWACATGVGWARGVCSGTGYAVVRAVVGGEEVLQRIGIEGFSSGRDPLRRSDGLLDLRSNQVTPSIGFAATEMSRGREPFAWYFDTEGTCRNPPELVARQSVAVARAARETVVSPDGYRFEMDLRWPASAGDSFSGPTVVMLYGAYGLDLDLDSDPDLGLWLERGFAVATPHVRGGGPEKRHLAGTRAKRDRSVADAAAAIAHLRRGSGAVTATRVVAIGASAGGFLAATTVNTCRDWVDACVVVNGFVDPVTSLTRQDTMTRASDEDEWGDPLNNPNDLAVLSRISPVANLAPRPLSVALVVVSGRDVRVNPRQGLKWYLRYRELGGDADLWFDPRGSHDCWGAGLARTAMVDWVEQALSRRGRG